MPWHTTAEAFSYTPAALSIFFCNCNQPWLPPRAGTCFFLSSAWALHKSTKDSTPSLWGNFLVGWHRQQAKPGSWHFMLSCWAKAKRMWTGPFPSNYVLCLQTCLSEILFLSFLLIGQNSINQIRAKTHSLHWKRESWEGKVSHVEVWYGQYEPSC